MPAAVANSQCSRPIFSILEYSRKILPICFFVDHCNLLMLIKYVTDTHVAVGCSLQHTTNSPPVGVLQLTTILASGCFQFPFLLQLQSDWTAIKVQTKLPIFEKTHLAGVMRRAG